MRDADSGARSDDGCRHCLLLAAAGYGAMMMAPYASYAAYVSMLT